MASTTKTLKLRDDAGDTLRVEVVRYSDHQNGGRLRVYTDLSGGPAASGDYIALTFEDARIFFDRILSEIDGPDSEPEYVVDHLHD